MFWLSLWWTWFCPSGLRYRGAVDWLHWLQNNISLRIGLFFHMSHKKSKYFLACFQLCYCFSYCRCFYSCCWTDRVIVLASRIILSAFSLFFLSFQEPTLISVKSMFFFTVVARWFMSVSIRVSGIVALLTAFNCSSSGASKPLSVNSLPRCVTICLYVPFSKWAWILDLISYCGILAYMNCSMMASAAIRNASLASFTSSSKKGTNFRFAGFDSSFWIICFVVAIFFGFYVYPTKNCQDFSQILSGWVVNIFECL